MTNATQDALASIFEGFCDENRACLLIARAQISDSFFDRFPIAFRSFFHSVSSSCVEGSNSAEPRFLSPLPVFYKALSNMSVCDETQKNRRRDQKLCAETIGKPLRRQPEIKRKSHRRNKPRALVRKLAKCPISGFQKRRPGRPGEGPGEQN